jgi:DNA repair photolyase
VPAQSAVRCLIESKKFLTINDVELSPLLVELRRAIETFRERSGYTGCLKECIEYCYISANRGNSINLPKTHVKLRKS